MCSATFKVLVLTAAFTALGCSSSNKKIGVQGTEVAAAADTAKTEIVKKAAVPTPLSGDKVTCSSKTEERIIEVRTKDKGCETAYTKGGNETVVATSNSGNEHCAKVQSRIHENLKSAGFSCQ